MEKLNLTALDEQATALHEAGFTEAGNVLIAKANLARKLAVGYEHFRIVTEEKIKAFQAKLKKTTERPASAADAKRLANPELHYRATVLHDQLTFVAMDKYPGVPPADVLNKVKEAKSREVFDRFEVAEVQPIASEIKLPDPIVFGRIDGCTDYFFIAEWGTDVSINDLIGKHDG